MFKKKEGNGASKRLGGLNPGNTWHSCDLNSELSDSIVVTFFQYAKLPFIHGRNCFGDGGINTHTQTHMYMHRHTYMCTRK